ncbi:hypothetical protein [Streptomyces sp. ODS28]|uniref:hypothetical protein n=1 Tax=Streptomyces sp. ODS28 TaxID=3136688 RepID=UPI0031E65F7F
MIFPLWHRRSTRRPVPEPLPSPVVWAGATAGSIAVLLGVGLLGEPLRQVVALVVFCLLAAALGLRGRALAAPGTATVCWGFYNSFLVVPLGELSWSGLEDARRLGLLLVLSLLGTCIARAAHAAAAYRQLRPYGLPGRGQDPRR